MEQTVRDAVKHALTGKRSHSDAPITIEGNKVKAVFVLNDGAHYFDKSLTENLHRIATYAMDEIQTAGYAVEYENENGRIHVIASEKNERTPKTKPLKLPGSNIGLLH